MPLIRSRDFSWKFEIFVSTQALKLKLGQDKFGKRTMYNLQTRINFRKKSHDQVDKIIDQLQLSPM